MATSSTNKQPLLIDRVLHNVVDTATTINGTLDITGTNTATVLVDGTGSDGCLIEDIYSLARSTTEADINLYVSTANDYLRPSEGIFVGTFKSATTIGGRSSWEGMPKVLAPMPHTGTEQQFTAFYLPKGLALWVARQSSDTVSDAPIVGAQGGFY